MALASERGELPRLPRDIRNESTDRTRLVCELLAGANPELCRQRLLEIWPVSIEITVRLRASLPALVRGLVDDPVTQSEALTALLSAID
jgi:hypothetical protein